MLENRTVRELLDAAPVTPDLRDNWFGALGLTAVVIEIVLIWRLTLGHDRPPMEPDAGIFQHIGWYLTEGGRLYVDAWEPKLPLPYETTAALAVVAGDDMYLFHLLNVGLMALSVVGIVLLVGLLAHRLTGDPYASTVAGLSMFLLPGFAIRPAYGFKARYLLLFTGLLAIYLFFRERHVASGVAAAASVGYWQLGAIFPLLVVGLALHRRDRRVLAAVVAGGLGTTVLMLLPVVVVWDSVPEMIAQTVLIPTIVGDEAALPERLFAGVLHFKWASPLVLVGVYGLRRGLRSDLRRRDWWVLAGAGWFGLIVFFVDFEVGGYTDLIAGLAFVALGLGLFAATLTSRRRRAALAGVIAVLLIVNVVAFGSLGLLFPPADTPEPVPMEELRTNERALHVESVPDDTPDVRYLYWNRERPATCHYRLSLMEIGWLELVGDAPSAGCSDLVEVRTVLSR